MDGVVNVYKTAGPTSHDVVNDVRRLFGQKRVGHAGTLDPMATGVLVVCLGQATRIVEYLVGSPKEYRARMILGQETDTEDSTGTVTAELDASDVTEAALRQAAASFVGEIDQVPPMVSALKHQGKPLYKLAREGKVIEREPRKVTVYSIEVTGFTAGSLAEAEITVKCSSGTYIRTLCADIGKFLGCGGSMSALERTRVGRFAVEDAVTVSNLAEARVNGRLADFIVSPREALSDLPSVEVDSDGEWKVIHGMAVPAQMPYELGAIVRMISPDGRLLGIGTVAQRDGIAMIQPKKVFGEVRNQG